MTELTSLLIKLAFKKINLLENDHLSSQQLLTQLTFLNNFPYDNQIFQELWDECQLNSRGQVKLRDFIDCIVNAQQLLLTKFYHNKQAIDLLDANHKNSPQDLPKQIEFKSKMEQLLQQRAAIKNSLTIIKTPFINKHKVQQSKLNDNGKDSDDSNSQDTIAVLTYIVYISLVGLGVSLIGGLQLTNYRTIIVYQIVLSNFCLQTISRKIIKFNCFILLLDLLLTLIWLLLYWSLLWNPPTEAEQSQEMSGYLKFTLITHCICIGCNLLLILLFLTQWQLDENQVYMLRIAGKELSMRIDLNPLIPSINPLAYLLIGFQNSSKEKQTISQT